MESTAHIYAKQTPLSETLHSEAEAGFDLRTLLSEGGTYRVFCNGREVERDDDYIVRAGNIYGIVGVPKGSGGDFFSQAFDVFKFALLSVSTFGVYAVLKWDELIPMPEQPDQQQNGTSNRYASLTGTRNRIAPFAPVPIGYGKTRTFPPFAAQPFTQLVGNDQYLYCLFMIGIGEYNLTEAKLGETLLTSLSDLQVEATTDPQWPSVTTLNVNKEIKEAGWASDATETFGIQTTETGTTRVELDFEFPEGITYRSNSGSFREYAIGWDVFYREVTASPQTWNNVADLTSPSWYESTFGDNTVFGDPITDPTTQRFARYEYAYNDPAGTVYVIWGATTEAQRITLAFELPEGQYEVRVRRTGDAVSGEGDRPAKTYVAPGSFGSVDEKARAKRRQRMYWSRMRSMSDSPAVALPTGMTATFVKMRIKATDNLSGTVDSFNCLAERKLPNWDKASQSLTALSADASFSAAMLDVLTGQGNARAIDITASPVTSSDAFTKINLDALSDIADGSDGGEDWEYAEMIDYSKSVYETLLRMSGVGRRIMTMRDGKYDWLRDNPNADPVQIFTPRNSWGFSLQKNLGNVPHAVRVKFRHDSSGYNEVERTVYDIGYDENSATEIDNINLIGVVREDYAWRIGRYYLAQRRLRPETVTLQCDIENLVAERGDPVLVQSDVALWDVASARITAIDSGTSTITIDSYVQLEQGTTYVVQVRRSDTTTVSNRVTQQGVGSTSIPSPNVPINELILVSTSGMTVGDLVVIGTLAQSPTTMIVKSIDPGANLTAKLTLVDAAPDILTIDTESPQPTFTPGITLPPNFQNITPPKPDILDLTDNTAEVNAGMMYNIRVNGTFTWGPYSGGGILQQIVQFREVFLEDSPVRKLNWLTGAVEAAHGSFAIHRVYPNRTYEFRVALRNNAGMLGPWSDIEQLTLGNAPSILPETPQSIEVENTYTGVTVKVGVEGVSYTDAQYVEIFYSKTNDRDAGVGSSPIDGKFRRFQPGYYIGQTPTLDYDIPLPDFDTYYFWCRFIDQYGNYSSYVNAGSTSGTPGNMLSTSSLNRLFKRAGADAGEHGYLDSPWDVWVDTGLELQLQGGQSYYINSFITFTSWTGITKCRLFFDTPDASISPLNVNWVGTELQYDSSSSGRMVFTRADYEERVFTFFPSWSSGTGYPPVIQVQAYYTPVNSGTFKIRFREDTQNAAGSPIVATVIDPNSFIKAERLG